MDNQTVNLIISMGLLVLLGLFSARVFSATTKRKRESKAPRLGAEVHVASKRTEGKHKTYFVTFRLKNDELMELAVPEDAYEQLQEEDFVKIIFKGETFEGFRRLDESADVAQTEESTDEEAKVE